MPRANEVAPAVGPASRSSAAYRMWSELLSPDPADQSGEYPAWLDRAHGCEQDAIVRKVRWLVCGLMAAALMGAIGWAVLTQRDPMFRGKRESQWIAEVEGARWSTEHHQAQVALWRSFGPEGLRVLERALKRPPPGRAYAKLYARLEKVVGRSVLRLLPRPSLKEANARLAVLELLASMGREGWPAWPSVASVVTDREVPVRLAALSFFTGPPEPLLKHMSGPDKARLVKSLLKLLKPQPGWTPAYRSVVTDMLRYFPEHAARVAPALAEALKDPAPEVRLHAARSLCAIDPQAARKAGAIPVVMEILRGPDPELAGAAAHALAGLEEDADAAVAALVEALGHTNGYVAAAAVWALGSGFPKHRTTIISALRKAAERKDEAARCARGVLERLGTNGPMAEPAASVPDRP